MVELDIESSGRTFCPIYISRFNSAEMIPINFKIDTGADFTTISKSTLCKLNYSLEWIDKNKIPAATPASVASGENIPTYFVPLQSISLFGVAGINYPFGVLLDDEILAPRPGCEDCAHIGIKKMDYRLLLGNDLLSCFDIRTDRDCSKLYLERRSSLSMKAPILFPNQHLHSLEV